MNEAPQVHSPCLDGGLRGSNGLLPFGSQAGEGWAGKWRGGVGWSMDYRLLGASGCAVSGFGLGTMTFGSETDEPGAHRQLDRFVEVGGTFVDTADVYSGGMSEEIIAAGSPAARPRSPSR